MDKLYWDKEDKVLFRVIAKLDGGIRIRETVEAQPRKQAITQDQFKQCVQLPDSMVAQIMDS